MQLVLIGMTSRPAAGMGSQTLAKYGKHRKRYPFSKLARSLHARFTPFLRTLCY